MQGAGADYRTLIEKTEAGRKRKITSQQEPTPVWGEHGETSEQHQKKKLFLMAGNEILPVARKQTTIPKLCVGEAVSKSIVLDLIKEVEEMRLSLLIGEEDMIENVKDFEEKERLSSFRMEGEEPKEVRTMHSTIKTEQIVNGQQRKVILIKV